MAPHERLGFGMKAVSLYTRRETRRQPETTLAMCPVVVIMENIEIT